MRKLFILFSILLISYFGEAQVPFGENTGYYGNQFTDQNIYDLMYAAGARKARPFLSLQQWIQYGISPFTARFIYPHQTKGMNNNVFTFYIASAFEGGSSYVGQSTAITAGGNQSMLPASLWDSVFTIVGTDTTINTANLYAQYVQSVYNAIAVSGNYTYFEPFNEPDLNNYYVAAQYDSSYGPSYYNTWATRQPEPDELINAYDSLKNEVRLYQIVYQTIHFLSGHNPAIQICAGGISLRYWLRQALKVGFGKWIDNLSIHNYPYYYFAYWTPTAPIGGGNARYSDMLIRVNDSIYNGMQGILGQNTYIAPQANPNMPRSITETNEMRWNYSTYTYPADIGQVNKFIGNDHIQRNYDVKAVCDFWRLGFNAIIFYETGDAEDSGVIASGDYHNAEGVYPNLDTSAGPPGPALLPSGIALATLQRLFQNYTNPVTAPGVSPTGNPFTGTDGIQVDSAGVAAFILWTQTNVDSSEVPKKLLTYNFGANTYKQINQDGSSPGNVTGVVTLSGDATFFMPVSIGVVPNAGPNQTLQLPTNSTTLTAAGSSGPITSYQWSQESGPNTATIVTPTTVTTTASGLIAGVYRFRIELNGILADTASVVITVNSAIVSNAGSNQTITLPATSVTLNGSGSTGVITSYLWSQTNGPAAATIGSPTAVSTVVSGLTKAGTYTFTLQLNGNPAYTSSVNITVNPIVPVSCNCVVYASTGHIYFKVP